MALVRTIVVAALCAGLAVPASAGAAQRGVGSAATSARATGAQHTVPGLLSAAAAVASTYWAATPCHGQITLSRRSPPPAADPATNAWVTFGSPLGANDLAAPASTYTYCMIAIARWRWPTSASMVADWDMLCATMTHEMGHLLGRGHDSAPGSVMAAVFTAASSVPPICRATRPVRRLR